MALDNNNVDQIKVLIDYQADFSTATKQLKDYLESQSKAIKDQIAALQLQKKSSSKEEKTLLNSEINLLKEKASAIKGLENQYTSMKKKASSSAKIFSDIIDSEVNAVQRLQSFADKTQKEFLKGQLNEYKSSRKEQIKADKEWNDETARLAAFGNNLNKQSLSEELNTFKSNRAQQLAEEKRTVNEAARIRSKTAAGAWENGSTFGHKVVTTAEYAAAGTAIYGVAKTLMAMATSALEADLNMRTMSAVLKISKTEATSLDESVRKLGETYGGTTGEIEQVAIALGRAGVKTKDVTDATKVVLAMARLTGDTFEQSSSAVISYQQVFGDTKNIIELGNKLAYVANVSRLSTQDIGTFSNYALAAAKDVGLTEDAVGGLAAAFSNAGVNASTIGTQIRRFTSLLTENSTDVDNFFRGIGVNQANLLADLQKGGETSNKALLEFVDTLSKVDKQKFTGLVGQMDILAGNSLKLMRNNSSNINKYVSELQTGVSDQLENTRVILESYKVTYESIWNSILNQGAKFLQSDSMNFMKNALVAYTAWRTEDEVKLKQVALAFNKDTADASMKQAEDDFKNKKIDSERYLALKSEYLGRVADLEKKAGELAKKETKKSYADQMIELDNLIRESTHKMNTGGVDGSKLTGQAEKEQQLLIDNLVSSKLELYASTKKQSDADNESFKTTTTASLALEKQLANINAMKSAKLDTANAERIFNESADAQIAKNNTAIINQTNSLNKYADAKKRVEDIVESAKGDPTKLQDGLLNRLKNISTTEVTKENRDALEQEANVLQKQLQINNDNIKVLTDKNTLIGKNLKEEESASRKAESAADKAKKIADENDQAKTKIAELSRQINGEEELTLGKAQSKLNIDTQLVALAYEKYQAAVGTKNESAMERDYNQAMAQYLQTSYVYINKIADKEKARTEFNLEMTQSLDVAIEKERVRLGIIEKATDTEYAQLSLKYEKKKAAGDLNEDEIAYYEQRLAELDTLNKKKKDVSTLAMEYQREIAEQDSVGYMASKAGLAGLESGMMEFFDVTSQGWLDWHNLVKGILSSIYKELLQQLIVKQAVAGISMGISSMFGAPAATAGTYGGVTSSAIVPSSPDFSTGGFSGASAGGYTFSTGGTIPTKGYASGGVLNGGTGIRDDIYLGNISGTQVFAMGGEFITRKDAVNSETKGTLDYINKTGSVPNAGSQVNVPVSINIENQTGQGISADMISQMTKQNGQGEYEKVVSIVLKAATVDPRVRSLLKGK